MNIIRENLIAEEHSTVAFTMKYAMVCIVFVAFRLLL